MSKEKPDRAISNCIKQIVAITSHARFLTLIDRIGQRGTVSSLEFDNQAVLSSSICLGLPNPSGMPNAELTGAL